MAMITLPEVAPANQGVNDAEHIFCCNPDRALCGEDLTGEPISLAPIDGTECRLCLPLTTFPCSPGCHG